MRISFRLFTAIALVTFTTFTACKKDSSNQTDNTTEVTAHSEDQTEVSNGIDDVTNDINVSIESEVAFSGKNADVQNICGATTVVDTLSNPRKITITFNGLDCSGQHTRTGSVVVSMPSNMHWKNAGAVLTVTYNNVKITRVSDNKSITINGTQTITNVTGGLLFNLPNVQTIVHTISSSNMSITFDNNTQRQWQIARKRTFTYDNGIVIKTTGNHTDGNNTRIAEWGTNRFGHAFVTSITEPLTIRQSCSFRLTSGRIEHTGFASSVVTFGLDAQGNATACPGTGHYYFKLVWTGPNGNSQTVILPY